MAEQPPRPTKQLPCRDCKRPVEVGLRTSKQPRCAECGITQAIEAARQLHARSGPYYDRWLASNGPAGRPRVRGTPMRRVVPGQVARHKANEYAGRMGQPLPYPEVES